MPTPTANEPPAYAQHFGEIATLLIENGYLPVPIIPGTKRPRPEGWPRSQAPDFSCLRDSS